MSPPSPARSPLAAKCENAQASPDAARAPAASTFDLGPAKPPRLRACATHHPVRKLAPSSGVEAILGGAFNAPFNDGRQARTWNENRARQHAGANIFGAQSPRKANHGAAAPLDAVQRRQRAVAPTTTAPRSLTLQELRQACRARGVNPGGSRDALIERLDDAIASGACEPIPANASEAHKAVGAGARYASRANEVRAPSAPSAATSMRESQRIWNDQIRGNDIFGTSFVDAPAAKKRVVEGPNDTLTLGDDEVGEDDVEAVDVAVVVKSVGVEDAPNVVEADEDAANAAGKRKRSRDVIAPEAEEATVATAPKQPSAGHRAKAWESFQGAGLFSEQWTAHEDEDEEGAAEAEAALVKSSTTSTGAWKTLEEEEAEQAQDDAELEAEREADAAVAAAERELAEELARESSSD